MSLKPNPPTKPVYTLPPKHAFLPTHCGSAGEESTCSAGDLGSIPGLGRSPGEGIGYPFQFLGFPCGSAGKESTCSVGDLGSIPGLGISPGEGKGYPTPVFWPREFCGLYSPWGCKELDTTEWHSLSLSLTLYLCIAL